MKNFNHADQKASEENEFHAENLFCAEVFLSERQLCFMPQFALARSEALSVTRALTALKYEFTPLLCTPIGETGPFFTGLSTSMCPTHGAVNFLHKNFYF